MSSQSKAVLAVVLCLVTFSCLVNGVDLKHKLFNRKTQSLLSESPFEQYFRTGILPHDSDPFSQVRSVIDELHQKEGDGNTETIEASPESSAMDALIAAEDAAFVEVGVQKVRSYCEICILVMQMKQRGQPHLCAGLNANHYVTCIEVLESLLRADKAAVYWLKNGCMHMDSTGPEIVRPCPALNICSWVPNLFAQPPSIVRDGVESLCPKDPKFLPTIPNEYKALLQPQQQAAAAPAPTGAAGL